MRDTLSIRAPVKKLFNYRPICFATAFLALGILCATFIHSLFAILLLISTLIVAVSLLFIFKRTKHLICVFFFMLGIVIFLSNAQYFQNNYIPKHSATVSATVDSEIVVDGERAYFYVKNIYYDDQKAKGRAYVSTSAFEPDFNAGDIIKIQGNISSLDFKPRDYYFASAFLKRTTVQIKADEIEKLSEQKPHFILALEMKLKKSFASSVSEDTASICVALIYGDKTGIDKELYHDVILSGLAHLLAVSGTHISIFCGALYFLLRKLGLKKKYSTPLLIALLFLYSLFCSFTPSVTRAFIMSSIFLIADLFGQKKDNLSTLCFAGIIILALNPLSLFDIAFQLSFASVSGLFLLFRSLKSVFRKGGKVSSVVAGNLSVNIATYPIVVSAFGFVPIFSVLANIIILPFVSIIFISLLVGALLVLLFSISSVLIVFEYILIPIKAVVFAFSSFDRALITFAPSGILAAVYYFDLILFSRFIFLSKRTKIIVASVASALGILLSFFI